MTSRDSLFATAGKDSGVHTAQTNADALPSDVFVMEAEDDLFAHLTAFEKERCHLLQSYPPFNLS